MNAEITWRIDPGLRSAKKPTRVYGQQSTGVVKRGTEGGKGRRVGCGRVGCGAVVAHKLLPRLNQLPPHSTRRGTGESGHYAEGTADRMMV